MVLPIVGKDKPGCGGQLKRQVIRGGKTSYEATITMQASYIHMFSFSLSIHVPTHTWVISMCWLL